MSAKSKLKSTYSAFGFSILAWSSAAAPITPDSTRSSRPLVLTMTGSASRPQIDGTRIEWIVTAANNGTEALTDIVLVDTLPPDLALNRVDFERGKTVLVIDRQSITITINRLDPGTKTEIHLYTNASRRNATIENTVCTKTGEDCVSAGVQV